MNSGEAFGLARDVVELFQKMQIAGMAGDTAGYETMMARMTPLVAKCREKGVSFCFFLERKMPSQGNQYFTETTALVKNWPQVSQTENLEHGSDTAHFRATFVYLVVWTGHVEVRPEGIKMELMGPPENHGLGRQPPDEPLHPHNDRILSPEEMERFLRNQGLEGLDSG